MMMNNGIIQETKIDKISLSFVFWQRILILTGLMGVLYFPTCSLTDQNPLPVNLRTLREESRSVTGIQDIYGSLYEEIGFHRVFKP